MRTTVKIYFKSGQILKLKGVKNLTFNRDKISWKVEAMTVPVWIDPEQIVAITQKHSRLFR